jgi:hypothetical protein
MGPSALGTVCVMAQNDREITRVFHDATKQIAERVRTGGHFLDFANMPIGLKHDPDLEPIPLPVDLPERAAPASRCSPAAGRRAGAVGAPGAGPHPVPFGRVIDLIGHGCPATSEHDVTVSCDADVDPVPWVGQAAVPSGTPPSRPATSSRGR